MRVIQAGVGGFGQSWIYAVRDCDGFEHVALVDPNVDALLRAGEIVGVPIERQFTGVEEALASVPAAVPVPRIPPSDGTRAPACGSNGRIGGGG